MGIGEFSAFVAGEIEFGEDTSWAAPVVTENLNWRSFASEQQMVRQAQ